MKKIITAIFCLSLSCTAAAQTVPENAGTEEINPAALQERYGDECIADGTEGGESFSDELIAEEIVSEEPIGELAVSDGAAAEKPARIIYAVESELMSVGGEIINMWQRPFVYNDTTYVPLRNAVEKLGGTVEFNAQNRDVYAYCGGGTYTVNLDDSRVRVYNDVLFVPIRDICNAIGANINWYGGLVTIDTDGSALLTDEEVTYYKEALAYTGFTDAYFTPRYVVNPYVKYTYDFMNSDVNLLARIYPDLISVFSIGKSTEGRDITAFKMGKGDKKVILCGSMHAREHIATNFLMYLADSYAYAYANNWERDGYSFREALDNVTFIIVPMVNPDGINLVQNGFDSTHDPEAVKNMETNSYGARGWKATSNGVDLNNNFDVLWRSKGAGPAYAGYSGPYPACEPETQAMQNLINNTDFKALLSFHSQGQVIYWMDPNCDQSLVGKFEPYVNRICEETGFEKMPSDGVEGVSGYMTDYVRYYKYAMAMTIELCPYVGDYPYPEEDFDTVAYPMRNIGLIMADIAQCL